MPPQDQSPWGPAYFGSGRPSFPRRPPGATISKAGEQQWLATMKRQQHYQKQSSAYPFAAPIELIN
jgi:hypothetical protein